MRRNRLDALEATLNETQLRQKMVQAGKEQKAWIRSVNDRFQSGRPDLRLKVLGTPHLDVELKICKLSHRAVLNDQFCKTGLRKLQVIELRDMNAAGIPAVGALYWPERDIFTFSNYENFQAGEALRGDTVPGNGGKPDLSLFASKAYRWLLEEGNHY